MKKKYSIYSVFGGLLIIVVAFVTIVIFVVSAMKSREYDLILEGNKNQLDQESVALIKLMGRSMSQVAWDYTYWDELVTSVEKRDPQWFEDNITTIITSFRLDYVAVYNAENLLIHEASSDSEAVSSIIPDSVFSLFKDSALITFFVNTPHGLYRVYGASIHPTSDPMHKETSSSGYLFVSKKWDDALLSELSTLSGTRVSLIPVSDSTGAAGAYSIVSAHNLPGWDKEPVAKIKFLRESDLLKRYRESTLNIVLLLSASLLVILGLFMYVVVKWVTKPLKLVTRYIETEDGAGLKNLKTTSLEYCKVGLLLSDHFRQTEELIAAKKMAEESDKLKSAFLANMSHEIRTPMNGIMGFAALLTEPGLTEEDRQSYLKMIEESGNRMLNIINDLINISIIDAGQIKIHLSKVRINELTDHIYEFFRHEIEGKNLEFNYKKGLDDEAEILTDRDKLYAILINLVKNSSKYTHEGSIMFGYSLNEDNLLFYVSDTGIGIPKERQEAVFGRFIQADMNISRNYEGAGLGLSISKAYVEELGGKIWLESVPGVGSTFFFTIPRR